jgi:hypothetical protein
MSHQWTHSPLWLELGYLHKVSNIIGLLRLVLDFGLPVDYSSHARQNIVGIAQS